MDKDEELQLMLEDAVDYLINEGITPTANNIIAFLVEEYDVLMPITDVLEWLLGEM